MKVDDVLNFWFLELEAKDWWKKDSHLDNAIRDRFGAYHEAAKNGELDAWKETPKGALALILILDQFSRNIYRDTPDAFSADELALSISQEVIKSGKDKELSGTERSFLYMPFMHSESSEVHKVAVELFKELGTNLEFELAHKKIIDQFGRYPHRNKILKRESTAEEIEFLKGPGSSF